jgi:hypothetical protein
MDQKFITPLILGIVLIWVMYRRVRRTFGRQPVYVGRLRFRVGLFAALGVLMVLASAKNLPLLGALLGGVVVGAMLGWVGLRHTRFVTTPEGRFYIPHTYMGLLITALFVGRLMYRLLAVYPEAHVAAPQSQDPLAGVSGGPLTSAILGLMVGYYVIYYLGVLRRSAVSELSSQETPVI